LYQCFFTLPSVREGKAFAISLQLFPVSRMALSRCSSPGVHGVFVLPFFFAPSVGVTGAEPTSLGCSPLAGPDGEVRGGDPAAAEERRFRGTEGDRGGGGMAAPLSAGL